MNQNLSQKYASHAAIHSAAEPKLMVVGAKMSNFQSKRQAILSQNMPIAFAKNVCVHKQCSNIAQIFKMRYNIQKRFDFRRLFAVCEVRE